MSEYKRNRRKNKKERIKKKNDISRKDKILGIIAIVITFLVSAIAAIYFSLSRSGFTLF
jgi:cell division protein FtsL